MLLKRSASEMEWVAAQAGVEQAHRQWLHALRDDLHERLSNVSFRSTYAEAGEDSFWTSELDPAFSDEGGGGTPARLPDKRTQCAEIRLCSWGVAETDAVVDALGSIRLCAQDGEADDVACGERPPGGGLRSPLVANMFAAETSADMQQQCAVWLHTARPPMLRRQRKIRRLSPEDLLTCS